MAITTKDYVSVGRLRTQGYIEAMEEHNMPLESNLILLSWKWYEHDFFCHDWNWIIFYLIRYQDFRELHFFLVICLPEKFIRVARRIMKQDCIDDALERCNFDYYFLPGEFSLVSSQDYLKYWCSHAGIFAVYLFLIYLNKVINRWR